MGGNRRWVSKVAVYLLSVPIYLLNEAFERKEGRKEGKKAGKTHEDGLDSFSQQQQNQSNFDY